MTGSVNWIRAEYPRKKTAIGSSESKQRAKRCVLHLLKRPDQILNGGYGCWVDPFWSRVKYCLINDS